MILIAVINTDEQIADVLEREFPSCHIVKDDEEVTINNNTYCYYSHPVRQMPTDEVTIYVLEKVS